MAKNNSSQWETDYERSGFLRSPDYRDSLRYFRRFTAHTSKARMVRIGTSPQGRSIECLIVAKDGHFTPGSARKHKKAVVLIQNGIHAGEIEGKDACMLLLRDILINGSQAGLLDQIVLLVIPVLNVDGHERTSEFNRPNQNGPEVMGWRTNSHNLNLNRDFLKADSIEVQSFLTLYNQWLPDLFIDNHTTNGADYQYHITYALEKSSNIDAPLATWGQTTFLPSLIRQVESDGFLTAPYIQFKEETIESGIIDTPALPRFSTGYAAVQNRLGLLVETHSLKPYKNRVESTYSMDLAALRIVQEHHRTLRSLNVKADLRTSKLRSVDVGLQLSKTANSFEFKAFKSISHHSSITGDTVVQFSSEPETVTVPFFEDVQVTTCASLPNAYVIPLEFSDVIRTLELHGVVVEYAPASFARRIVEYRFTDVQFNSRPYEGRLGVQVRCAAAEKHMEFPAGTAIVRTNQRTNRIIANLLEPEGPDSFVSWGFFNAWFERKEYAEAYIMEPIAQEMLRKNEALRQEFEQALEVESFRDDPSARLDFFYTRSPFFDSKEMRYPIYRIQ